ncbi:MAG: protein translocase subunit SecD [Candidatus Symbiodolus clandestinus]
MNRRHFHRLPTPPAPLNQTSVGQLLLILLPLLFSLIYALPNGYGEIPALQVRARSGELTPAVFQETVQKQLAAEQLIPHKIQRQGETLLLHWPDRESQRQANELLNAKFSDRYITALTLIPALPNWLARLGAHPMLLGLDLRGGVRLLLAIDTPTLLQQQQQQLPAQLRATLRSQSLSFRQVTQQGSTALLRFSSEQSCQQAYKSLVQHYPTLNVKHLSELALQATLSDPYQQQLAEQTMQRTLTILRKRIDELGVSGAIIQQQGNQRISVELPGVQDSARAKQILGATARLQFHLVNSAAPLADNAALPSDSERYYQRDGHPIVLYKQTVISGEHITHAEANLDEYGRAYVAISLDSLGGQQLYQATEKAVGELMAALLIDYRSTANTDHQQPSPLKKHQEVISSARIQSRLGQQFQITGVGSLSEARNLALLLRSGTLNAPLQIVEERVVGPSLGKKSIQQGLRACAWGLLASLLFMLCYYRFCGIIASIALIANIIMLIASLSLLPGTTLTLPSIAGIVLTVGMAVDANVLIFERIKEELRHGKSVQQAIDQGYRNAFSSILDANLTTLITAILLYVIGSGPVRGFAVTLTLGLGTSLFTAILLTRAIMNRCYGGKPLTTLSI